MGFLKAFGLALVKGLQIVGGIAPYAGPLVNAIQPGLGTTIQNDLAVIAGIVQNIEGVGQALSLSGVQKLTAASPLVTQAILSSALLAHHKVADEAKFKAAVDKITGGVADLLSSLEDKVETTSKT